MKLLVLESSRSNGGTEQHTVTLAAAMRQRGHQVFALARANSWVAQALPAAGVPTLSIAFGGGADPRLLGTLAQLLITLKPDWLVSNDSKFYWPLVVLRQLGGPRVALFRHMNEISKPMTRRWVPRLADRFFVVSNYMREHLGRAGASRAHLRVLHNPVDVQRFRPDAGARARLRTQLGIADHETVVAFAGRITADKGVFVLEEAFARAAGCRAGLHMVWIGDGGDEARLRAAVATRAQSARHHFLGWAADLAAVLPVADVLAVPSLSPESFGRVAIEAQACGVPVLCSDDGGLREVVQPGIDGQLLPPGDVSAWAQALLAIDQDAAARAQRGAERRAYVVERFSNDPICRQLEMLLAEPAVLAAWPPDGFRA